MMGTYYYMLGGAEVVQSLQPHWSKFKEQWVILSRPPCIISETELIELIAEGAILTSDYPVRPELLEQITSERLH